MPKVIIHNAETNEIIEREMNSDELTQWQTNQLQAQEWQAEQKMKAEAKLALLEKLGITEEEAKLLLS